MKIVKIWIDQDRLYGKTDDGRIVWQSLLYYPRLKNASSQQRDDYEIGYFGIHWNEIDEDVSFESFDYDNPEPTGLSKILLSLPEINISAIARNLGIQQSLLAAYKNGTKKASPERERLILDEIKSIGQKLILLGNQ